VRRHTVFVLLLVFLASCQGQTDEDPSSSTDDDGAESLDDDDAESLDDDDDAAVADDDDASVSVDDYLLPPEECVSEPDVAASPVQLVAAMDVPTATVVAVTGADSDPSMLAARTGLGVLCPLVGNDMALLSTGRVEAIADDHDHEEQYSVDGDRATLDLSFAVPGDAASVRFRFLWLTRESEPWPGGSADDGFSALVDGAAWSGEVALDTGGNLVVGSEVTYDLEGPLDLAGTGFELGSSTGWIRVEVPVAPDSEAGLPCPTPRHRRRRARTPSWPPPYPHRCQAGCPSVTATKTPRQVAQTFPPAISSASTTHFGSLSSLTRATSRTGPRGVGRRSFTWNDAVTVQEASLAPRPTMMAQAAVQLLWQSSRVPMIPPLRMPGKAWWCSSGVKSQTTSSPCT